MASDGNRTNGHSKPVRFLCLFPLDGVGILYACISVFPSVLRCFSLFSSRFQKGCISLKACVTAVSDVLTTCMERTAKKSATAKTRPHVTQ